MRPRIAMAASAHPDDIEFMMAGTLLALKEAGLEIHMWNLANGSCGTAEYGPEDIVRLRALEAARSAEVAGAILHPPLTDDLAVFYNEGLLARAAAVIRAVRPDILLVPSPFDYMDDHINTSQLLVTSAFVRGMRNFRTEPQVEVWEGDCAVYHALPYGLRDGLRRRVVPGQYVDVAAGHETKRRMLAEHRTQQGWLDSSQGVSSYIAQMEDMARKVGAMSGRFALAEGWQRHLHLGLTGRDSDPLAEVLGDLCWVDSDYEDTLERPRDPRASLAKLDQ